MIAVEGMAANPSPNLIGQRGIFADRCLFENRPRDTINICRIADTICSYKRHPHIFPLKVIAFLQNNAMKFSPQVLVLLSFFAGNVATAFMVVKPSAIAPKQTSLRAGEDVDYDGT